MGNVESLANYRGKSQLSGYSSTGFPTPPAPPGDGGNMDHRIDRLEEDVKDIKSDMKSVRSDLTEIKVTLAGINAKLDSKVDYKWLFTVTGLLIAAVGLIVRFMPPAGTP